MDLISDTREMRYFGLSKGVCTGEDALKATKSKLKRKCDCMPPQLVHLVKYAMICVCENTNSINLNK